MTFTKSLKSFIEVLKASPEDADLISYMEEDDTFAIILRRPDGICNVIARCDPSGFNLMCLGASEARKALWSHDLGQFITGTIEQMVREA
jgi:hypothetical protein